MEQAWKSSLREGRITALPHGHPIEGVLNNEDVQGPKCQEHVGCQKARTRALAIAALAHRRPPAAFFQQTLLTTRCPNIDKEVDLQQKE